MKLIHRHAEALAREITETFPAAVIQGARQVGKSTLAQQLAETRDARILTLDDEPTLAAAIEDPTGFVNQHPGGMLVIDEIQRHPELTLAIKASIDRDRRPGRFLLTGSSDLLRARGTTDSLAGRAATIPLRTFSQGELSGTFDDFAHRFRTGIPYPDVRSETTRSDYARMIVAGGYPGAFSLGTRMRNTWFDGYVERLVRRDARELVNVTDPNRLMSLLRLMAANQAGELVKARFARDAAIPATSITAYLDTIETLFLVDLLRPWTPNLTSRETGKAEGVHSGRRARCPALWVTEEQLAPVVGSSHHMGGLMEGFVVGELLKQQGWSDEEYELFHYRTRDGLEVDVIVEFGDGQLLGLEVKSGATFRAEHFTGLRSLRDRLGDRFAGGIVLNTGSTGYRFADRLYGLPVSSLWG